MNFNTFVDASPDIAWIQQNADWLLLYSVASLGIMPFITIYMIETEQFSVTVGENETSSASGDEETKQSGKMEETRRDPTNMIEAMRYFIPDRIRLWVYVIVLVLNTIALVTTFVAIQLIRNQTAATATARSSSLDDSQHERFLRQVREKVREKLWGGHEQYTKTLEENDLIKGEEKNGLEDYYETSPRDASLWRLPHPGIHKNTVNAVSNKRFLTRIVPGECAICMEAFACKETVVWSSNPKDIHCFHRQCFQSWLETTNYRNQKCPCCRQSFFLMK